MEGQSRGGESEISLKRLPSHSWNHVRMAHVGRKWAHRVDENVCISKNVKGILAFL